MKRRDFYEAVVEHLCVEAEEIENERNVHGRVVTDTTIQVLLGLASAFDGALRDTEED